jgi:hypothetical protein
VGATPPANPVAAVERICKCTTVRTRIWFFEFAHTRQSALQSGPGLQKKNLDTLELFPSRSAAAGRHRLYLANDKRSVTGRFDLLVEFRRANVPPD